MHGLLQAHKIVRDFQPDVVIGTGGYVCGPVLLAASLMHVPTLIQEQNVIPGVTNKILSRFVTKIAAGCQEAVRHFPADKVCFTGNPIRSEVLTADRAAAFTRFGLDPAKKTVLISGGAAALVASMMRLLMSTAILPAVLVCSFCMSPGRRNMKLSVKKCRQPALI